MSAQGKHQYNSGVIAVAVVGALLVVFFMAICTGMTNDGLHDTSRATRALETYGFSDVQIVSSDNLAIFQGCGQHDAFVYEARATNPAGKRIDVLVCCGLLVKACTVRTR